MNDEEEFKHPASAEAMMEGVQRGFNLWPWPRKPLSNPGGKGGVKGRVASRAGRSKGARSKGRGRKRRGMED